MFSIFTIVLAASSFIVMSDCEHFTNVDAIADQTEIEWKADQEELLVDFDKLRGKKILLLVHGYNNESQSALEAYHQVYNHLSGAKDIHGHKLYDAFIGYLWPGGDHRMDYYIAKKHTAELAKRLRVHLFLLSSAAAKVDILAHSMGNRLVFEALEYPFKNYMRKPIKNFYSLAPAVDENTIERKHQYYSSTQHCQDVYIFHSNQDDVLKFLYKLAERNDALGFKGVEDLGRLPKNVQLVDCSAVVQGHGEYFTTPSVYEFIRTQLLDQLLVPSSAPNIKLLEHGVIEVNNH